MHHGVKITDEALVDAAVESDRYIADRFLPDKAIDLIDEAAAKLKMEISTKPEALDEVDRKVRRQLRHQLAVTLLFEALLTAQRARFQSSVLDTASRLRDTCWMLPPMFPNILTSTT